MNKKRALVLCPGRGSYARPCLGSLAGIDSPSLKHFDQFRAARKQPTITEMDSATRFSSRLHVAGENASILTAGISLADLDQINHDLVNIVGVCGNSMGWYTALGYAKALPLIQCAQLIDTMGAYQINNVMGGQLLYPLVDAEWRIADNLQIVRKTLSEIDDLYWSIKLGGQAVLGGTEAALKAAKDMLPPLEQGTFTFPLQLPLHSAFHTPIMANTARQAADDLSDLNWKAPEVPLIDGDGMVWRPRSSDPTAIRSYTLGRQIVAPFDFSKMLTSALGNFAPDIIILPGPGSNLGSAVAQVLIQMGWQGIRSKTDFLKRQEQNPIVISMRWADQRALVT